MKKWREEVKVRKPRRTMNRPGRGMLATFDDVDYKYEIYETTETTETNEKYERV